MTDKAVRRAPSELPDLVGRVIGNRYMITAEIGGGGFGAVYRAVQTGLEQAVAVKIIRPHIAADKGWRDRFWIEAQIYARINSPYVVQVHEFGQDEGDERLLFLAMEYLPGKDLASFLTDRETGLDWRMACRLGSQVLGGLAAAHELGIVHRDLKPPNVMVVEPDSGQPFAKILDFGIGQADFSDTSDEGLLIGTPQYMSPEQTRGETLDGRSDLYAFGALFYAMLVRRLVFDHRDPSEVVRMQQQDIPPPPSVVDSDIHPALDEFTLRLLEKSPHDRFANAREARDELDRIVERLTLESAIALTAPSTGSKTADTGKLPMSMSAFGNTDSLENESAAQQSAVHDSSLVGAFVHSLAKAYRTFHLYPWPSAVYDAAIDEVFEALGACFDGASAIRLDLEQGCVRHEGEVVLEEANLQLSVAYQLFADGIRRIHLFSGITRDEVTALFECLHKVSSGRSRTADLVTLLWERKLKHVRVMLVEELVARDTPGADAIEAVLRLSRSAFHSDSEKAGRKKKATSAAEALATALTESEREELKARLHQDRTADHMGCYARSLLDSLQSAGSTEQARGVIGVLGPAIRGLLEAGDVRAAVRIVKPLNKLRGNARFGSFAGEIEAILVQARSSECVQKVLHAGCTDELQRKAAARYLEIGGEAVIEPLLALAPSLDDDEKRTFLATMLAHLSKEKMALLHPGLTSEDRQTRLVCLDALAQAASSRAAPLVAPLLQDGDSEVRCAALRTLVTCGCAGMVSVMAPLLTDPSSEVRLEALAALRRAPAGLATGPLIELLESPELASRPRREQRELFDSLRAIGGREVAAALVRRVAQEHALSKPHVLIGGSIVSLILLVLVLGVAIGVIAFGAVLVVGFLAKQELDRRDAGDDGDLQGRMRHLLRTIEREER